MADVARLAARAGARAGLDITTRRGIYVEWGQTKSPPRSDGGQNSFTESNVSQHLLNVGAAVAVVVYGL